MVDFLPTTYQSMASDAVTLTPIKRLLFTRMFTSVKNAKVKNVNRVEVTKLMESPSNFTEARMS